MYVCRILPILTLLRYVKDERTIILCVVPANADISTSDALQIAMRIDPKGDRTIGVITKVSSINSLIQLNINLPSSSID